jgi:hypothetical protein
MGVKENVIIKAYLQSTRFVCTLQTNISCLQALARYTPLAETASAVVAPTIFGSDRDEVLVQVLREIATISIQS